MTDQPKRLGLPTDGIAAPLRHAVFRRIWFASLVSNLGILIQGVGAAWAMTQMTSAADKVALVQTALMLPIMLIAMPAGAIADMHDRRIVALISLGIALVGATVLTVLAWFGLVTPNILLALCFVVGSGMALFGPAWQASVSEQVPTETLPAAVALGLLHGGAQTYGIMLGAFGMGAVFGALNISEVRRRMSGEAAVRACAISMAGAIAAVALSTSAILTAVALVLAGAVWMLAVALFNIGVQLSAPRWVAGRSLAAFQASIAGGIAVGSWGWGHLTDLAGAETALLVSAGLMLLSPLLGIWLRMPRVGARNEDATELLADPEVQLSLTGRSGPLVVEIEYRVAQDNARAFHNVMQDVQLSRQRNGAYGWSIARDIGDPELWSERYHCPTWLDYLRQRNRATQSERALHQRAIDSHLGPDPIRLRRMLERPLGSVRWKEDTPDRAANEVLPVATAAGSST